MQIRTYAGIAAASAAVTTSAMAVDVDFSLEAALPGEVAEYYFTLDAGAFDEVTINLEFASLGDASWAGDLLMGLIGPDGTTIEWGGFDTLYTFEYNVGDFPAEWDTDVAGSYSYTFDLSTIDMAPAGEWTLLVSNGWSGSAGADWIGAMSTAGCDDCPDFDCNENGIEDADDIASGFSTDCDLNTVPDECDPDCDNDGTPDACDKDECPGIGFDLTGAGGAFVEYPFTHSGPLDQMTIDLSFTNAGDLTWAGDVLFAIHAADGSVGWEVGGFDLTFGYTQVGDFPAEWDVADSGMYSHTYDFSGLGVEGTGDMILAVGNGYGASIDGSNWNGIVSLDLCTDCIVDCNDNGIADADDILNGTSEDCNANSKPDECDIADGAGDANNDGIPDTCQLECGDALVAAHTGAGTENGGVATSFTVEFDGNLSGVRVSGSYVNDSADQTWAGDILIAVCDPLGNCIELGGFNDTLGYNTIGDFSAAWDVADTGEYAEETFDASAEGLSGDGTWTVMLINGWTTSLGATWDLDIVMCGTGDGGGGGCNDDPDLNNDGCVNGADVGLILSVWAQADPPYGDLNCDGVVDGADFGQILAAWQACP